MRTHLFICLAVVLGSAAWGWGEDQPAPGDRYAIASARRPFETFRGSHQFARPNRLTSAGTSITMPWMAISAALSK